MTPLDHIRERHGQLNYAPEPKLGEISVDSGLEPIDMAFTPEYEYRVSLECYWRQRVQRGMSDDYFSHLREQGKRAIAKQLYGDIIDELVSIRYNLCRNRYFEPEELKPLENLIDELTGRLE